MHYVESGCLFRCRSVYRLEPYDLANDKKIGLSRRRRVRRLTVPVSRTNIWYSTVIAIQKGRASHQASSLRHIARTHAPLPHHYGRNLAEPEPYLLHPLRWLRYIITIPGRRSFYNYQSSSL